MQEILFENHWSFTSYRPTFTHVKNDNTANSLQIGEVELLGVAAPASPLVTAALASGGQISLTTTVPGRLWSTTNLTGNVVWKDEGAISGTILITPAAGEPQKYYRVVVTP